MEAEVDDARLFACILPRLADVDSAFAVASREKVNAILARKTSVREAIEEIAKLVEVHASQAHAFVSRGNTIDTVLDVDAVPFYPAALRNLFNSS